MGLRSAAAAAAAAGQQPGLMSPLRPDGLNRSSSAPGSGSEEGSGGSAKQWALIPPAAAKSKRCEAGNAGEKDKNILMKIFKILKKRTSFNRN